MNYTETATETLTSEYQRTGLAIATWSGEELRYAQAEHDAIRAELERRGAMSPRPAPALKPAPASNTSYQNKVRSMFRPGIGE